MKCNGRYHELLPLWAIKDGWNQDNIEGLTREWDDLCNDYTNLLEDYNKLLALQEGEENESIT